MIAPSPRTVVATLSVLTIFASTFVAWSLAPAEPRAYLGICLVVVGGTAISSVVAEPRELLIAVIFAAMPIMALAGDGAPSLAMGPLAAGLLVGAELNAWSWELGGESDRLSRRRRGTSILLLGAGTLVGSIGIGVAAQWTLGRGLPALMIATGALVLVAYAVLSGARRSAPGADGDKRTLGHSPVGPS